MDFEDKAKLLKIAAIAGLLAMAIVGAIVWRVRYVSARKAAVEADVPSSTAVESPSLSNEPSEAGPADVGLMTMGPGDKEVLGSYVVESEVDTDVETKRLVDYTYREVGTFKRVVIKDALTNEDGSVTYAVEVDGKGLSVTVPSLDEECADGDWQRPEISGEVGIYEEDYFARLTSERCAELFPDAWNAYAKSAKLFMADSVYVASETVSEADGKVTFTVIDPRLAGERAKGQDTKVTFDVESETFEFSPIGEYKEPKEAESERPAAESGASSSDATSAGTSSPAAKDRDKE